MDSQHNLSADHDLEDYEDVEYESGQESGMSVEKALTLFVQPTMLVVGLICNVLTMIVVLATPSLRRQSRAVYVLVMAVLDILLLFITALYLLTIVGPSLNYALFRKLHGCRFISYAHRIPFASQWLLAVLGLEICLARFVPVIGRKLSTPRGAGLVAFALISFTMLFSLIHLFNMEYRFTYCYIDNLSLYLELLKTDLAIYYIIPFLTSAVVSLLLCGLRPSRGQQESGGLQRPHAGGEQPPYHRFDQMASTMTSDGRSGDAARATATNRNSALPAASCVYYAVFVLPMAVALILKLNLRIRFAEHFFRSMHILWICFYQFKLFVYIIGWNDFRTRFVQLAGKMFPCCKVGISSPTLEDEAAIVLDMVPSDVRTAFTDRLETLP